MTSPPDPAASPIAAWRLTAKRLWVLLRFAKPQKARIGGVLALIVLNACLRLPVPFLSIRLIDNVLPSKNLKALGLISGLIVVMTAVYLSLDILKGYLLLRVSRRIGAAVETHLLRHVQSLPLRFLHARDSGHVLSRFVNDLTLVNSLITDTVLSAIQQTVILTCGVVAVLWIHPRLAAVSFTLLPAFAVVNWRYSTLLREQGQQLQEKRADVLQSLAEVLSTVFLTKVFARIALVTREHFAKRAACIRTEAHNYLSTARASACTAAIAAAGPLLVLCFGGYEIVMGRLTIGELVGFSSVLAYLHGPTQALTFLVLSTQTSLAAMDRISELLEMSPEHTSAPEARFTLSRERSSGPISFDRVSFAYERSAPVLHEVSFDIPDGAVVGVIGTSGAGKSSIAKLLLRLYDPQEGRISIGGRDVRDYDLCVLRRAVGLVSGETGLRSGTVLQNITFGRRHATKEEVIQAASQANAHEFVSRLPNGYNTIVGHRGYQLSAGERQRLALARMFLARPRILILDEATSSLDSQSEEMILDALAHPVRKCTIIVISHRFASVRGVDICFLVDNHSVSRVGSVPEMIRRRECRRLYGGQIDEAWCSAEEWRS